MGSIVCWQVEQRPVQHLNRGWNRRTARGRVRPVMSVEVV